MVSIAANRFVMTKKTEIGSRLPVRRGLVEAEAAMYVGIGVTKFRELVATKVMPKPRLLGGARAYDIAELDAAFASCPHEGEAEQAIEAQDSWSDFRDGNEPTTIRRRKTK